MGIEIRNDLSAQQVQQQFSKPNRVSATNQPIAKTSGISAENSVSQVNGSGVAGVTAQQNLPAAYGENQSKIILEQELDKLLKQIMPDLGISFRVHDSGSIITTVTNKDTHEVVREFPAEKILDIVHSMCQRLGIVSNKKV